MAAEVQAHEGRGLPHLRRYLALTRDPMHVGEGSQAVGPVDNTICRCKSTHIPVIPGSSLRGCLAWNLRVANNGADTEMRRKLFGYAEQNSASQGRLYTYQGDVLLFPISTYVGTVWITWPEALRWWFGWTDEQLGNLATAFGASEDSCVRLGTRPTGNQLGLGDGGIRVTVAPAEGLGDLLSTQGLASELCVIKERAFALPEVLFSQILNDNLEVRTSVRIDDKTGAASDTGLFTYEALPALTVLGFEFGVEDGTSNSEDEADSFALIEQGLHAFEFLGLGAKTTSGMGHFKTYEGLLPVPGGGTDARYGCRL